MRIFHYQGIQLQRPGGGLLSLKKIEENDWLELLLGAITCSLDTKAVQELCQDLQLSKPMCPGAPEWDRERCFFAWQRIRIGAIL